MRNSVVLPGLMLLGASCLPPAAHATGTAPAETLVCNGTRANGTTFNFAFEPNTNPAPTPGAACAPSGKQLPKGTAVMGQAPKAPKVYAVVITAPAGAGGGANASTNGAPAETLVCNGTRANGTTFNFAFEPNTTPAPTPGAACAPSGKQLPKGTAVMGQAPKAPKVYAVVITAPAGAGGGANASTNGAPAETLVCNGTRANGTTFNFAFEPNTTPAPTPGAACAPSGKQLPKGTAVMGQAPKAPKVYAVVITAPAGAGGGANASTNGAPAETLVCNGTRANGTTFNFAFEPNTTPAPTPGAACAPSGKQLPKGTVVMGHAPKAPKVFAVVIGTPPGPNGSASPPAGGGPNANSSLPPGQAFVCSPAGYSYNIPFKADANPAPTLGAICALSDDTNVRGTVSIGPPGGLSVLGLSAIIVGPPPAGSH